MWSTPVLLDILISVLNAEGLGRTPRPGVKFLSIIFFKIHRVWAVINPNDTDSVSVHFFERNVSVGCCHHLTEPIRYFAVKLQFERIPAALH